MSDSEIDERDPIPFIKTSKQQLLSSKKYYNKHKLVVLEKLKEPIVCEYCNMTMSKSSFSRHKKGKTHLLKVQLNEKILLI